MDKELYVLWKRDPSRGNRWHEVGRAETQLGALLLMRGSGQFTIRRGSSHPNTKSPLNAQRGALNAAL